MLEKSLKNFFDRFERLHNSSLEWHISITQEVLKSTTISIMMKYEKCVTRNGGNF